MWLDRSNWRYRPTAVRLGTVGDDQRNPRNTPVFDEFPGMSSLPLNRSIRRAARCLACAAMILCYSALRVANTPAGDYSISNGGSYSALRHFISPHMPRPEPITLSRGLPVHSIAMRGPVGSPCDPTQRLRASKTRHGTAHQTPFGSRCNYGSTKGTTPLPILACQPSTCTLSSEQLTDRFEMCPYSLWQMIGALIISFKRPEDMNQ
jgi:hypothetical protein